ncbi:MAG TPA: DUF1501 domain-containing protein [Blastocatellia bacterium]
MPVTRREFIKRSMGAVSVAALMPGLSLTGRAQGADRRIFVVIQCIGGNDGLNTVVPYANPRYRTLRPTLGLKETDLKDDRNRPTMISNDFALHPSLGEIKDFYDAGRVAILLGVGYPKPNQSHFDSMDIWHTANVENGRGTGWLGRYADLALADETGLVALSSTFTLPRTLRAARAVIPSISLGAFPTYDISTDPNFASERDARVGLLMAANSRQFPESSFIGEVARNGSGALEKVEKIKAANTNYTSTVAYPENNVLAAGLKMVARVATTATESMLFYVTIADFDHHARQADTHAALLRQFSLAVKAFYDDMQQHALADKVLLMQWSEFGRRPNENGSEGTDHGAASMMFVIGDPVAGGLYGEHPSLEAMDIDEAGNLKFTVDFRAVYATVLDRWLGVDHREVLDSKFENIGFLA